MPLTSAQQRTIDAMTKEHGGVPNWYAGHVMTRDARIIPCSDPEYRNRKFDPSALNVETEDDPADLRVEKVVQERQEIPAVVIAAVLDEKNKEVTPARETEPARVIEEVKEVTFVKQPNDSALDPVVTVDLSAPLE